MSYHGIGLALPSGELFAPSLDPGGYVATTTTAASASAPTGTAASPSTAVRQEQLHFNTAKMVLPAYAASLMAVYRSSALTAAERRAMLDKSRAVSGTLTQMFNRVGTLYPAGWTRAQLDQLVAIDRSSAMPTDADTELASRSGSARLIRDTNALLTAWQNLVRSLRSRGRWPGGTSGGRTVGGEELRVDLVTGGTGPRLPGADSGGGTADVEQERARQEAEAEAERARQEADRLRAAAEEAARAGAEEAAALRERLRLAEEQARAAAAQAADLTPPSVPTRGIPWLWIGGGAAALGVGYLVWRGMRE